LEWSGENAGAPQTKPTGGGTSMPNSMTRLRDSDGRVRPLHPKAVNAAWEAFHAYVPLHIDNHPKGGHNPRVGDKVCFRGMLYRHHLGCSWEEAADLVEVSDITLRRRRDAWVEDGVFDAFVNEAIKAYDRIIGLDLSEVSADGSIHKAPAGGDGTGPSPVDRAKIGWKWSMLCDKNGIPFAWVTAAANRPDCKLFLSTVQGAIERGLHLDIGTLHLDRGYDSEQIRADCAALNIDVDIQRRRKRGEPKTKRQKLTLGLRWPVERTNSWLSNSGQLRRNTDRKPEHRSAQFALAVGMIITVKLIKWAARWG
jgi:transposase